MKLHQVLRISPLDQCKVAAGKEGLDHNILSINSYDAPDVINWLKPGELVLTSGYVFKNDEDLQSKIIKELAYRQCGGLAVKTHYYIQQIPQMMLAKADELHVPLLEIPYNISLRDLIFAFLQELFRQRAITDNHAHKKAFLTTLMQGDIHGKDTILAEGRSYGLLPGSYICLSVSLSPQKTSTDITTLFELIASTSKETGINVIYTQLKDIAIILQFPQDDNSEQAHHASLNFAKNLQQKASDTLGHLTLSIGIGSYHSDVTKIGHSYQHAQKSVTLGHKVSSAFADQHIFDYQAFESYDMLQHIPNHVLQQYVTNKLGPLIEESQNHPSRALLHTLAIYLDYQGNTSDTARHLNSHRNTITSRISRIKELLNVDIEKGENAFQLQLALRSSYLLNA